MRHRSRYYILDEEKHIQRCDDLLTWARWFGKSELRIVARTKVSGDCDVSTVFLGMDHRFSLRGPPVLFETMVFGGPMHGEMWRYASYDDAEVGHAMAVKKVLAAMKARVAP